MNEKQRGFCNIIKSSEIFFKIRKKKYVYTWWYFLLLFNDLFNDDTCMYKLIYAPDTIFFYSLQILLTFCKQKCIFLFYTKP